VISLELNRSSHEPLYLQVAKGLKGLIASGALKKGDRLPPGRELASLLKVHRTTVSNAYEKLEEEGILHSHVGRGTFVLGDVPAVRKQAVAEHELQMPLVWETLFASENSEDRLRTMLNLCADKKAISFVYALPSSEFFPMAEFHRAVNTALRKSGPKILNAGRGPGFAPLCDWIAKNTPGRSVRPDEVMITNGCQNSLNLIRKVLVAPGETVLVENPTYPGALSVLAEKDIRCIGVPMRNTGIDLAVLENILSSQPVKLLYTIPNFHNPTGTTMDLPTRKGLLQLSRKYRMPIVEDDIYGQLRYEGHSLPSLSAMDQTGSVIYINSFSKTSFPGLRVGWIIAAAPVIERLRVARQTYDLHTNLLAQAALFEMLQNGSYGRHLKNVRKLYAANRNRMLAAMKKYFPSGAAWTAPEGGMSVWVTLPAGTDTSHLLSLAAEQGLIFSPGQLFFANAPVSASLRLAFSMVSADQIEEGIRHLSRLVKKHVSQSADLSGASSTVLV
jgi:GntR family transcriptional regulator/MocR family aminotransferase